MKTVYCSDDGKEVFLSKRDCQMYERKLKQTVRVPLIFLREAIRQCTPYHISSKERTWLREKLEECLPDSRRIPRHEPKTITHHGQEQQQGSGRRQSR